MPDADRFAELLISDETRIGTRNGLTAYAQQLRRWHDGHAREGDPELLTSSTCTNHTEVSRRRFSETRPGSTDPVSRFYKLSPLGLSRTLRAGTVSRRGGFTSPRPIHYAWPRCVTVREMARLHGFPDWFRFHATKWHGARQIGNAVPPPLARAMPTVWCVSPTSVTTGWYPPAQSPTMILAVMKDEQEIQSCPNPYSLSKSANRVNFEAIHA